MNCMTTEKTAIEKKACELGFDSVRKLNINFPQWEVYLIFNEDEVNSVLGYPTYLLKKEKRIRLADEAETLSIMEMPSA